MMDDPARVVTFDLTPRGSTSNIADLLIPAPRFQENDSHTSIDQTAAINGASQIAASHFAVPSNHHHETRDEDPALLSEYAHSEYYSARSTAAETFTSQTDSTGLQSQFGATWRGAMAITMNSGFASGTPRTENWKGVREGRERETGLRHVKGVGRIGKPPVRVPDAMVRAMRAQERVPRQTQDHWSVDSLEQSAIEEMEEEGDPMDEDSISFGLEEKPNSVKDVNFKAKNKEEFDNELRRRKIEKDVATWNELYSHQMDVDNRDHNRDHVLNEAMSYVEEVRNRFADRPAVYNRFTDIMVDFKSEAIDTPGVIRRVCELFADDQDLIQGFNMFLPTGWRIACGPTHYSDVPEMSPVTASVQSPASLQTLAVPGHPVTVAPLRSNKGVIVGEEFVYTVASNSALR